MRKTDDFRQWLLKQIDRDDPVGDLARDFAVDPTIPSELTPRTFHDYLSDRGASEEALNACGRARKEWIYQGWMPTPEKEHPCHQSSIHFPGGAVLYEPPVFPIGRLRTRLYCKYCYNTHADWHLMRKADYGEDNMNTIVLCGRCEHTSMLMLIDNVNESRLALKMIRDEPARDCGPFGVIGFDPKTGMVRVLGKGKDVAK